MSTTPVQIFRRKDKTLVEAVLHTELAASALIEAEKQWGPIRRETARKLDRAGRRDEIPQHCHWDWGRKSLNLGFLTYRCCGIECDGKYQGLLLLMLAGKYARLPPDVGKPLVYIDYIESAPWNYAKMVDTPVYGGIGPVLVQAAVAVSYEEEFQGRIGLHALPQSEKFYRDDCKMMRCGPDPSYHNLRTPQRQATRQQSLFGTDLHSTLQVAGPDVPCEVVAIEKRRDGGTRYWCRVHRADATAKGGTQVRKCRAADTVPIRPDEVLMLDLNKHLGGVALWGAVPAVYDTTRLPMDRGIHVHARLKPESKKEMDWTYRAVRLIGKGLPDEGTLVSEIDAIYFMVSSIFGFPMYYVTCTHCGWPHLDKDWFSVHPHRRHLCNGCGKLFYDQVIGIGNPIMGIRDACGFEEHKVAPAAKTLDIKQSEYPGGIQVWGSNPAFLWTSSKHEEEGIQVHAFLQKGQTEPDLDDTFREVTIDGIQLDPVMVRVLMAQNVMPSLKGRVRSMDCPNCGHPGFDAGEAAHVPAPMHTCSECGGQFPTLGRTRNAVVNPLAAILAGLAKLAPRPPQQHRLDLLQETL